MRVTEGEPVFFFPKMAKGDQNFFTHAKGGQNFFAHAKQETRKNCFDHKQTAPLPVKNDSSLMSGGTKMHRQRAKNSNFSDFDETWRRSCVVSPAIETMLFKLIGCLLASN